MTLKLYVLYLDTRLLLITNREKPCLSHLLNLVILYSVKTVILNYIIPSLEPSSIEFSSTLGSFTS